MKDSIHFILGAGGHGLAVYYCLENKHNVFFLDDKQSGHFHGVEIKGNREYLKDLKQTDSAFIAIGDNAIRKSISNVYPDLNWKTTIHRSVVFNGPCDIGPGTVIMPGAVIQANVKIGAHCIINTGATIDHDCLIGDFSHIAPGVNLCGGVQVGKEVFIGVGANVIPKIQIGDGAFICAGITVINNVKAKQKLRKFEQR